MTRPAVTVFLTCAVAAGLAAAVWLAPTPPGRLAVAVPAAPVGGPAPALPRVLGVGGCMAASCHGGPADETLAGRWDEKTGWRSSGSCWVAADPHRGAYDALTATGRRRPDRPTAAEIVTHLKTGIPAHEDVRCLACHTTPALARPDVDPALRALRADGVGCESCHGPAGTWVGPHTGFGADRPAEYAAHRMTALFDVGVRAETCVGCHVGAPADPARGVPVRDMNHEMIAAGHPPLGYFDFAEYHRRLPRHWAERDRVSGHNPTGPGSEARRWLVGRYAQAEAACRLLADRAERAKADDPRTAWPEFAEFDCAACHHALPGEWRNHPDRLGTRTPGSLPWQPIWPVTGGYGRPPEGDEVKALLTVMGRPKPPGWGLVGEPAAAAADKLRERRTKLVPAAADVTPDVSARFPTSAGDFPDWDPAGQLLHGLAALGRDRPPGVPVNPGFDPAFDAVRLHRDWPRARTALDALLPKKR